MAERLTGPVAFNLPDPLADVAYPPGKPMLETQTAPKSASTLALLGFVVVAWGLNWVVMKLAMHDVPPLWAVTIRTALAAAVLIPGLLAVGKLHWPARADYPIVLVISLLHMVAFAALMTVGLTYVSAGRAIVLGYTTPLWVAPAAFFFLGERMSTRQAIGAGVGLIGLLLLVGPRAFDWSS
jgi:drug/metabolite transporter (DMT)-like permease